MPNNMAICATLAVVMLATVRVNCFNFTGARIADIKTAITKGQVTCHQIVQGYLDRIETYGRSSDTTVGAIISTNPEAIKEADALDDYFRSSGKLKGRLHCAPLVAKDNIDIAGIATTNGLNAFKAQIPLKDATVVKNCKAQGAIFIAKANMSPIGDKEAWGHSETGGLIRNPFALGYTTYGSSGGNAVSASAMLAIGGIATETGSSINLPSSAVNIVGLRPPVELLKSCNCLEGFMPNNLVYDVVGPMARATEDVILIFEGMIGKEGEYSNSVMNRSGLTGMKVNIFKLAAYESFPVPVPPPGVNYTVDPKVMELFTVATDNMAKAGANVKNVSVNFFMAAMTITAMFTADQTSCIPGWRDVYLGDTTRFGPGSFHSFDEIVAAKKLPKHYQAVWKDLQDRFRSPGRCTRDSQDFQTALNALMLHGINVILADADIAIWPTVPVFPAKLGQDAFDKDWGSSTMAPVNLVLLASWSGYPSITVPLGFSDPSPDAPQGLPIGLFMMSSPDKLPQLLKAAYAYQENFGVSKYAAKFVETTSSSSASQDNFGVSPALANIFETTSRSSPDQKTSGTSKSPTNFIGTTRSSSVSAISPSPHHRFTLLSVIWYLFVNV